MMMCDMFSKELVQGYKLRHNLRDNVIQELRRKGGGDALRSCVSDLGRLLIDAPEKGCSRPPLPAHLQAAPRHEAEAVDLMPKRVPTPFRWSTPSSTVASAREVAPTQFRSAAFTDASQIHDASWPAPRTGRCISLPVDRSPDHAVPSSPAGLSKTPASQSVPVLNLPGTTKNSRLRDVLAKMKKDKVDHTAHLRRCAIQMGVPAQLTSCYMAQSTEPIQKAADPKWSSDLKRMDAKVGKRIQYETRLSASGPTLCPELHNMYKML
jgi:hypothetical protein